MKTIITFWKVTPFLGKVSVAVTCSIAVTALTWMLFDSSTSRAILIFAVLLAVALFAIVGTVAAIQDYPYNKRDHGRTLKDK